MMKEGNLRAELINSLRAVSGSGVARLSSVVMATYGGLIIAPTREKIIERAKMSVRSKRWTGSLSKIDGTELEGRVGIGYYSSEAYYYTYLLHELGHNLVENLGIPSSYYDSYYAMADEEEKMCWEFAGLACQLMGLPYDGKLQDISSRYWELSQAIVLDGMQSNHEELYDAFEYLGNLEKLTYGFSMTLGDEFSWEDEVPVLRN